MSQTPTVLVVDGNSLLHRAFHASARTMYRDLQGHQAWAVRGLLSQLLAAVDRVCADVVVVGFDDRGILQITLIASWFNYINRVADSLGVGREP